MTTDELNTIVAAVVAELEKSGVDFDYKADQAKDDDLVFVIRGTAPNYQGVTVTWKGLLDIITAQATQAKNDAETAKNAANAILTQVQSKGTEITNFVATSKTEIETQKNESVNAVKSVYQTDLNELKGDLDTERNARIEADIKHSIKLQKNRYEIDNLKAKAEGKLYRTETVEAEAYTVDVPSSVAPYAEVQRIGGKSVVWNQLVDPISTIVNGVTLTASNGTWTLSGTATASGGRITPISSKYINIKSGHQYVALIENNDNVEIYISNKEDSAIVAGIMVSKIFVISSSYTQTILGINLQKDKEYTGTLKINIFDLTQMFGRGNEPTLEECKKIFSADYYPYDAGTIRSFPVKRVRSLNAEGTEIGSMDVSSITSDFKSAGSVHDEWSNGKVTKRIGMYMIDGVNIKMSSLFQSNDYGNVFYLSSKLHTKFSNAISDKFIKTLDPADKMGLYSFVGSSGVPATICFVLPSTITTLIQANEWFKSNPTTVYYELATPTEETVPEISNYIQVEGGGTLTFESDDAVHMPVPSTDRFVVDLS